MEHQGYFISFEGPDGSGKSTQIEAANRLLQSLGYETLMLREPGGTNLGEAIRALVLDPAYPDTDPYAELLLMCAARAQLVRRVIRPALAEGKAVLCDRFADSTVAYQGYGREMEHGDVDAVLKVATGGTMPHRTILLDADPERLLRRRRLNSDRMESEDLTFQARVRDGFLAQARRDPSRIRTLDADRPIDRVSEEIAAIIKEDLKS